MTDNNTILIVDDSLESLALLTEILTSEGFQVHPADSGELALASIELRRPELILMDIRMPGIDGFEVCRRLKASEETRDIPIIFVTVATEVHDRVEGFRLGAVDYICKPFQPEECLARIRTHLELSRLNGLLKKQTVELEQANNSLQLEITERKRVQEEFRTILYSIGDALITTDTEGLVKHINPVAERLTGWLEAEARGKPLDEVFHIINEETRSPVDNPVDRVLREGVVVGLANHTLLIARDGAEHPIADSGAPIRDESGVVNGVVLVFRDQTQERQAQKTLRKSEERLRAVLDATPFPIAVVDLLDDNIHFWSRSASTIFGHTAPTASEWYQVAYPDPNYRREVINRWKPFLEIARESRQTVNTGEYRVTCSDGSVRICEIYATFLPDVLIVTFTDITDRKWAENAIRESEEKFRNLFNNSGVAMFRSRLDGSETLDINEKFLEIVGRTRAETQGKPSVIFWEDPKERDEMVRRLVANGRVSELEFRMLNQQGGVRDCITSLVLYREQGILEGTIIDITESKRAEENLKNQIQFTETLLETIPSPVFYKDAFGRYLGCNRAFEEFWDKRREEVIGKDVYEMGPKEIADKYAEMDQELFKRPGSQKYEWKVRTPDGSEKEVIFYKASFLDADGKVGGLIGVILDITERKQAEEALKKLNHHHQLILSSAAEGILGLDLEGKHIFVNSAAAKMFGYKAEELLGSPSHAAWHHTRVNGSPYPEEECPICETLKEGAPYLGFDEVFWKKDGTSFPVDYSAAPIIDDGKVSGAVVTFWDISPRLEAEEAFKFLVSHAPMGIFIIQDGKYILINPGFETITGYRKEELLGHESECLAVPSYKEFVREEAIKRLTGKSSTPFEFQFITKNGEIRWGIETVAPIQYEGKRAILGYFMDITPQKQLQEQFLLAQKMEAVGTLAGGIAHDFNNILTAILGNIGLAALDDKIGPRVKDRLAQAEAGCLRAQALSQQLLAFAKGGLPVTKPFSVPELLTEYTAFACVGSPVKCETTLPENLWWVEADPGQIGQVFQNITINALQAMPTGGTIKVWAENLTLGTESGLPLSAGRYIKISVRDQGMGIPADHLPRIFDPYFTTKHKGSGLGLASTYAIIEKHHGHIAVESKPGAGTTFHIYLPAVDQQVTHQPAEDGVLLVGTGKILVMDDEEMVREVLGRLLARLGYEAEFARDGGEALEMFIQAHGSGKAFAAVILDLTVPGAMGGKETMARLLEIDPQVKAVVSSGYSDDPIMADFQKYGFSGVIAKPYRISELGKILNQVIMKKA